MRGTIGIRLQSTNISNAARNAIVPFSTSSGFGGGGRGRGGSFSGSGQFNVDEKAPGKPNSNEPKSEVPESPVPPGYGRGESLSGTGQLPKSNAREPLIPPGSGRGGSLPGSRQFNFNERAPGKPNSAESKSDTTEPPIPPGSGRGHGRGNPIPPPSGFPSFSSFMSSIKQPTTGRGRGIGPLAPQTEHDMQQPYPGPKKPIFFKRADDASATATADFSPPKTPLFTEKEDVRPIASFGDRESDNKVHESMLSGMGRGKAIKQEDPETQVIEENRHARNRRPPGSAASETVRGRQPILSRDDAVKNARRFLSRDDVDRSGTERESGPGGRGGFSRGRGRGRGRGMGRGRGFRGRDADGNQDTASSHAVGLYLGDDADGEKFAKKVGPEIMNQLTEAFEEVASRVLPSPLEDEYVEAADINYAIEFEPEYALEFDGNPDIDEKEPIPLRDALEKMKPFLMVYEGIQSQEEWEEIIEETMARVPLLKKIVDHYSGPDKVTAKKQQEELERVAKTLPGSTPSTVKQFANRAVISLQSNPGWGFDKKCQFMDKLVFEASQHYK